MSFKVTPDTIRLGLLVERKDTGALYKLLSRYDNFFTAQLVFPVPNRTTVHQFTWEDGSTGFLRPSRHLLQEYEVAYRRA